jgi:hypothetical protein
LFKSGEVYAFRDDINSILYGLQLLDIYLDDELLEYSSRLLQLVEEFV